MLVLSRKVGERLVIDNNIVVTVLSVRGGRIRVGIEAPDGVSIKRQELLLNDRADDRTAELSASGKD
jgi:carbon storage regulator